MNKLWRNISLLLLFILISKFGFSQIIEKAASSPVAVSAKLDSVNANIEISNIYIRGYRRTKPFIIQREVPFVKGQQLPTTELMTKLNLCKQQLMNTSLFVDVDVRPLVLDSNHVAIDIFVKERWYLFPIPYFNLVTRNFNDWWVNQKRSFDRVNYGIKLMQNNFTGRNDDLNVWLIGGYTQQVSLRYDNPGIDKKLRHGINIGVGFSRNREINYGLDTNKQKFLKDPDHFILKQSHVDFSYTYRPAIRTRHIIRAAYNTINLSDTVLDTNPKYLSNNSTKARYFDLGYTWQYSSIDYNPYPLNGWYGEASLTKRFGRDVGMWQLGARATYAHQVVPHSFIQLDFAGALKMGFDQPFFNKTMLGPASLYMRGLEYYVVEGVAGGVLRGTIKNEVVSFNVRNAFKSKTHDKIPFRIFVKAYGDLGYSYSRDYGYSLLNNKLLKTYGLGIDIISFYDVVLRFEYSFNPQNAGILRKDGFYFHNQNDW